MMCSQPSSFHWSSAVGYREDEDRYTVQPMPSTFSSTTHINPDLPPMSTGSQGPYFSNGSSIEPSPTMNMLSLLPMASLEFGHSEFPFATPFTSQSNSRGSSSHVSSPFSDTYSPSPGGSQPACSPDTVFMDDVFNCGIGMTYDSASAGHCVAMNDVQPYADPQPESNPYEDGPYPSFVQDTPFIQDGYQQMQHQDNIPEASHFVPSDCHKIKTEPSNSTQEAGPVLRRRRATSLRTTGLPYRTSRTAKRPSFGKRSSICQGSAMEHQLSPSRNFSCPFANYGCQSTFGSKNEWKRHVTTQHMRLGYWRCDKCPNSDRKPNDFNRKDLFVQHVRRMHPTIVSQKKSGVTKSTGSKGDKDDAEEKTLTDTAQRCYRKLRAPPEKSGCLFCDVEFVGQNSWEERMEHVGRHMEQTKKDGSDPIHPHDWQCDKATEEYLEAEGLIVEEEGQWVLVEGR